jgi:peptide/nickel transport system substrate-binding protein/oligopeptide transport system substrate-binding protein
MSARGRGLAFVLLCVLLAASCTGKHRGADNQGAAPPPRVGGILVISLLPPGSLDPATATGAEQRLLVGNLFDGLTTLDSSGAVRPAVASAWSSDASLQHWRFSLRPSARFSDGQPVDAESFKAAWEHLASRRTNPPPASPADLLGLVDGYEAFASGDAADISGISTPDPRTLEVDLTQPFADFPAVVADPRLSPIPPNALAGGAAAFGAKPVGNGPFMLSKKVTPGQPIDLVRNPQFDGRRPYLDKVRVQVVPDPQTAWLAFQHGQSSFAPVPPDQVAAARTIAGVSADGRTRPGFLQGPELGTWSVGFDMTAKPASDPNWRRAVSLAIDRSAVAAAFPGATAPATGVVPTGVPGAGQVQCGTCTHDANEAKSLLDGEGSAARKPVTLTVAATQFDQQAAKLVADGLKAVGLPVRVKAVAPAAFLAGQGRVPGQLTGFGIGAAYPRLDAFLASEFTSGGAANLMGFKDPGVDRLVEQARATADEGARIKLYQQAEQAVVAQVPVAPVLEYRHSAVLASTVAGFDLTPWGAVDLSAVSLANGVK